MDPINLTADAVLLAALAVAAAGGGVTDLKTTIAVNSADMKNAPKTVLATLLGFTSMPARLTPGINSKPNSSCFPTRLPKPLIMPVTFPCGRAWLAARLAGSLIAATIIGILAVACFAATAALVVPTTRTFGLCRINSSTSAGSRVRSPSA
jgi:hypothetical protein